MGAHNGADEKLPATRERELSGGRVVAVIVTYRPGQDVVANIGAIARQVERVVVVDNEASDHSRALLSAVAGDTKIEVIENRENLGIAAALNQGVDRLASWGAEWIATFDQDSRVPDGFVAGLLKGWEAFGERERVALVVPVYRDRGMGFVYSASGPLEGAERLQTVNVAAASGNLVSARALKVVGGFREDYFIDCVDFEFCLRCRKYGWLVLEVRDVMLDHAQGRWHERRFLWKRPRVNDYGAARRYYQARNRLLMYAEFASFDPRWTARDAFGYLCDFAKLVLFCEDRPAKLRAAALGWWHAVSGRRGRWNG